ncbi:hypothetical protein LX36DRAFT_650687 [Colletotrichum falcatum]|nr:hypothetical protein LX36DRAFT_650687 [Colletotrichum falcatum]
MSLLPALQPVVSGSSTPVTSHPRDAPIPGETSVKRYVPPVLRRHLYPLPASGTAVADGSGTANLGSHGLCFLDLACLPSSTGFLTPLHTNVKVLSTPNMTPAACQAALRISNLTGGLEFEPCTMSSFIAPTCASACRRSLPETQRFPLSTTRRPWLREADFGRIKNLADMDAGH